LDVIPGVFRTTTEGHPLMAINITALFCCLDDFCRLYQDCERHKLIPKTGLRCRPGKLCLSEMLFIMVLFHVNPFKDFKHFYRYGIEDKYRDLFGALPCYARFVQLMGRLLLPLAVLLHSLKGEETGIYFADSTSLPVCDNRRISSNRVFTGLAKRGKTAMGWFYGFKLHIVINHKAELVAVKITPGNADDRKPLPAMTEGLLGKLFADKGYLSKALFEQLGQQGLQLITGIRKTMRNYLMPRASTKSSCAGGSSSRRSSTSSNQTKASNTQRTARPSMPSSTSFLACSLMASEPPNQSSRHPFRYPLSHNSGAATSPRSALTPPSSAAPPSICSDANPRKPRSNENASKLS
jgi:Transposase DDE domain